MMKIVYNGKIFIFEIYGNEVHLWNESGITSLYRKNIDKNSSFLDIYEQLKHTMDLYNNGIIYCSDCGKEMKIEEVAGRYFAGLYCRECWEREWKEKEARETYE